jgi:hypothetical protein
MTRVQLGGQSAKWSPRDFFLAVLLVGVGLLIAAGVNAIGVYRLQHASTCSQWEIFVPSADCKITLDGTVVDLTPTQAVLDVQGRQLTMPLRIHGPVPDAAVASIPVQVTIYRGQPVHMEGPSLDVDADGSASSNAEMFLLFGMAALVVGGMFGGLAWATEVRDRRPDTPT